MDQRLVKSEVSDCSHLLSPNSGLSAGVDDDRLLKWFSALGALE